MHDLPGEPIELFAKSLSILSPLLYGVTSFSLKLSGR